MTTTDVDFPQEALRTPKRMHFTMLDGLVVSACFCIILGVHVAWDRPPMTLLAIMFAACGLIVYWQWNLWLLGLLAPAIVMISLPGLDGSPENDRSLRCKEQLKQIFLALHSYHMATGSFPPAYTVDEEGKPLCSWRVLILPYLDPVLAAKYRCDEPWDSANNKPLAEQIGEYYHCKHWRVNRDKSVTSYVAVVGPDTMWTGEKPMRHAKVSDGVSNTLHIIEWPETDMVCTEPRDITVRDMPALMRDPLSKRSERLRHNGAVHVLIADGSMRRIDFRQHTVQHVRAWLTRNGRENVPLAGC